MKNFLAAVFCLLAGAGLAYLKVPSIWNDFSVDSGTLEPAPEYSLAEARCKTRALVVNMCDLDFTHTETGEKLNMSYMLLGRMGGESVFAMQTPDKSYITSNIGIDYLLNRIAVIVIFSGLMFGLGLLLLLKMMRGARPGRKS